MSRISLSVIIPCYNEMANLRKGVLDKVDSFLTKKKYDFEVLVVDDGSTDGSVEFVREFVKDHKEFRLIENSHTGKAGAVTTGMLKAGGETRLFADMDQATPIEEVEKLLPFFDEGFDVVIGSRSTRREGSPLTRRFISRAQVILRKIVVGLPELTDTQCGFKMFRGEAADKLFSRVKDIHHGFKTISGSNVTSGFDIELLYIAEKMGYRIKEVPVQWLYVETRRVNPISDSIQGVLDLLEIKRNALRGMYSAV
ncbi:MAG TPA: glycosyltransferase [Patescibacteria group bacterium]|nr:glycosyltransferase [Patescibacteria group bacterium]